MTNAENDRFDQSPYRGTTLEVLLQLAHEWGVPENWAQKVGSLTRGNTWKARPCVGRLIPRTEAAGVYGFRKDAPLVELTIPGRVTRIVYPDEVKINGQPVRVITILPIEKPDDPLRPSSSYQSSGRGGERQHAPRNLRVGVDRLPGYDEISEPKDRGIGESRRRKGKGR